MKNLSGDENETSPLFPTPQSERLVQPHLTVKDWVGFAVAVTVVLLGIVGIVIVCTLQEKSDFEYGVVLDAGSTHTELFVYKWPATVRYSDTAVVEQIGHCVTNGGGISNYVSDPSGAGKSLKGCLKSTAEQLVPSYIQDKSPIYLGATAGMRLVRESNRDAADKIMGSVRSTLRKSQFEFVDSNARIISGEEEGLSSWVTVNYAQGNFFKLIKIKPMPAAAHGTEYSQGEGNGMLGALDLGGASTQITFIPSNGSVAPYLLRLYGRHYSVYTHSFLCYGKAEAEREYFSRLVKDSNYTSSVEDPCGPKGLLTNRSASYLWKKPCGFLAQPQNKTLSQFTFRGTSNPSKCALQVKKLFECNNSSCSFNGTSQPHLRGRFMAFAGYYHVLKDLNLTGNVTRSQLKTKAQDICNKTWNEIRDLPGNQDFIKRYCLDSQYVYSLLTDGYHFNDKTWNIEFVKDVKGRNVGWSLGFMINATNLIPAERPMYGVPAAVFIPVTLVCAVLISLGVLVMCVSVRRMYIRHNFRPLGLVT